MRNYNKTVRLKPDEYKSVSSIKTFSGTWIPSNGLVITKDGNNFPIRTPFTIDDNCEIEVQYNEEKHYGKVKYISSSPRRKYYMFLKWYIIILQILAIIATVYEIEVNGNYLVEGSPAKSLGVPFIATWLCLDIVIMRNMNTVTKWLVTIFSYFVLFISTVSFIMYLTGTMY